MVQEKIKQIVETIPELNYIFNDWTRANVQLDYDRLPACVNVLPVSGQLHLHNGIFRDYPNCLIAFLDLADLDFDGEENEATVERMKAYARRFIMAVNRSGLFHPIPDTVSYSVVYDMLDQNLTGVTIEVQLKELQGDCVR
ncbi:MAG: hypothetical protein ACLVKO_09185 [Dysgonomonas sp.]